MYQDHGTRQITAQCTAMHACMPSNYLQTASTTHVHCSGDADLQLVSWFILDYKLMKGYQYMIN